MIRKIFLAAGILAVLITLIVFVSIRYNESMDPPQLVANFVDINKVKKISKFRSCTGHTTIPQDGRETKRNMKHYVMLYPENHKENFVQIFAPYDGYIALLFGEEEIWIAPGRKSLLNILPINQWMFSVTHVKPKEGLKWGDTVKAGELIGHGTFLINEPGAPTFDAVYGTMIIPPKRVDNWNSPFGDLDSIFNHMSTEVLTQYEQKGITNENIIISKEKRDSNPCIYKDSGPYFENKINSDDWMELKNL